MIAEEREAAILALLQERGVVSLQTLVDRCCRVSAVTLRRDLSRLENQGKLQRTRGGAVHVRRPGLIVMPAPNEAPRLFDGLVLPPVSGRWAHTLRQQAMRRGIPFLAESAPQVGGVYLGPINYAASRELGMRAGREHGERSTTAELLLVALEALPNTRERVEGFLRGFTETFPGRLISHRVDGRGIFKEAMWQTGEAFRTRPTIDVVFGVNDHTILGALKVARGLGAPVAGYSVGGEGSALFDELARGGLLKATLALFPEVVGRLAVDIICKRFAGEEVGDAVITPAEILAPDTLADFYRREGDQWRIRPEVLDRMCEGRLYSGPSVAGRSIGFMLHYPSHDWYRNLAAAMRQRCAEFGVRFAARNAEDEVAEQLRGIRRVIAAAAAAQVRPRETLLVDGGECSRYFAEALKTASREATVVTNSLAVLDALAGAPGLKVLLTAGEYQPATRSLVGPSVGALLDTIRVDKAFVSPDGVSPSFGLSFEDERAALVCRRFCEVAREVIVFADHSVVGLESNVQAVRPKQFHTVLTDAGALSSHRFDLFAAGLRVIVADEDDEQPFTLANGRRTVS
jgi:DeoR/GlpR family transcriptional regulator of sugar metabolism